MSSDILVTPPRKTVSREAPNAPSREISSNATELYSIPNMKELPEHIPCTPVHQKTKLIQPGAPVRDRREFEERLKEFVEIHRLTLDFSNITTNFTEEDGLSTPPKRPNKKIRLDLEFS